MSTEVQIANIALLRIGVDRPIASLTESSKAAAAINSCFTSERDFVLRDFAWPFATRYKTLSLVSDVDEAYNEDYQYAYRYPAGCLYVRRIVTGLGRSDPNPPKFDVAEDDQGSLILTDEADVKVEYTHAVTDAGRFDAIFVSMLGWKLASVVAPSLSRIEKMAETAMGMYRAEKSMAEARAANESQRGEDLDAEWIRNR